MGRKSLRKKRNAKTKKVEEWTLAILPKLQHLALSDLTMDDLAVLMEKSKSTVYQYFRSKEEIFEYITEIRIQQLRGYRKQIFLGSPTSEFPFEPFVAILTEGVKDISSFYLSELKKNYPRAWKMVTDFLDELLADLKQVYITGIELNTFKNISPELLIKLDEYFVLQLITDYHFLESSQRSLQEVIKDYLTLKFDGLKK